MAAPSFPGFPPEGMKFLRSLERNNDREWFQPRKEIFDAQVKEPMVALVNALNRGLARYAPDYITDPKSAIYRIYRDTRFSSDKTPYKTHIAASFWKRGFGKHRCAGFYFSVSPKEVEVAGGVYMPGPEELLAIRQHVANHHEELRKIAGKSSLTRLMGELYGDQLSRVPKGFPADHPAADLIRRKQWLFYVVLKPEMATTPDLYRQVEERFREMTPFLTFLNTPLKVEKVTAEELLR